MATDKDEGVDNDDDNDDDDDDNDTCLGGLREGRGQGRREPWKKPKGWFNHEEDGEEWR